MAELNSIDWIFNEPRPKVLEFMSGSWDFIRSSDTYSYNYTDLRYNGSATITGYHPSNFSENIYQPYQPLMITNIETA